MDEIEHDTSINWKKYALVFAITCSLFFVAIYSSNYLGDQKIEQLRSIQDQISNSILSSETQFSLLSSVACKDSDSISTFSNQLYDLGGKLEWSQENLGNTEQVQSLKQYYSLLEIKDYLLFENIASRCGKKQNFIFYFYGNDNCADCMQQGYILNDLREKYPDVHVYTFDYNLDQPAVKTLISLYKVPNDLPALVINGKAYPGLQSIDAIEKNFPEIKKAQAPVTPKVKTVVPVETQSSSN